MQWMGKNQQLVIDELGWGSRLHENLPIILEEFREYTSINKEKLKDVNI